MTDDGLEVQQDNRFGIVPRAVAYGNVSVTAKAVYAVLSQFNQSFPSRRYIGERLGVSVSTIGRALRELSDAGFLAIEHRFDDNGAQKSSLYTLGVMTYAPPSQARPTPQVTVDPPPSAPVTHIKKQRDTDNEKKELSINDERFEAFWSTYPRHVGKVEARRAWAKAIERALPDVIIAGAQSYRNDPNREDQFTAHPTTWLNQGRWDDDPLPPRTTKAVGRVDQNLAEYQRIYGGQNEQQGSLSTLDAGIGEGWTDRYGSVGRSLGV